uniref:FBD domain-containing protein n=1 Tax=Brassica campestris TaxID=3711 RepID=M4DRG8_BRACM
MDNLSHLLDDLLLRILSLNTTKEAMATSLLSKRWRSLWTLVPGLSYDHSNHNGDYKSFTQFVYRSFLSNKAPILKHLHLSLGPDCPSVDIGLWINLALSRRVGELHIHIVIPYPKKVSVTLPSSLYTSENLQRLSLTNCVFLDGPVHVLLPSLKTLSLKTVTYTDNTSLQIFLSGCPNLEVLSVEDRYDGPPMDVIVVVPSLQRLHMSHGNIETRGTYVLDVPSLKSLEIRDSARCNFRQIENMPELVNARVCFGASSTHEFLKALTSVRRLTLTQPLTLKSEVAIYFSDMDNPSGWKPPSSVPECLLHSVEAFEWFQYKGRQVDREMATYVLKNALRLKTATFSTRLTDMGEKCQMLKELESVATASPSAQILFD